MVFDFFIPRAPIFSPINPPLKLLLCLRVAPLLPWYSSASAPGAKDLAIFLRYWIVDDLLIYDYYEAFFEGFLDDGLEFILLYTNKLYQIIYL